MDKPTEPKNDEMNNEEQNPVPSTGAPSMSDSVSNKPETTDEKPTEVPSVSTPLGENMDTTPETIAPVTPSSSSSESHVVDSAPAMNVTMPTNNVASQSSTDMGVNSTPIPAVPDAEKMSSDMTHQPLTDHKTNSKAIIAGIVVFVLVLVGVIVYLGNQMRVAQKQPTAAVVPTQPVVTSQVTPAQTDNTQTSDQVSDPTQDLNSLNQDLNQL